MGINSNINVGGRTLHVQTEDLGMEEACIVTHVFGEDGRVLWVARYDYSRHVTGANLRTSLPKVMHAHHLAVIQRVQRVLGENEAELGEWYPAPGAPLDSIAGVPPRRSQVVTRRPAFALDPAGQTVRVSHDREQVCDHDRHLAVVACDEGLSLYRRGDLEGALLCWSRAVELDPRNASYRGNLERLRTLLEELPRG
jgi:hypothetical protein